MTSLEADFAALGFAGYIINTEIQSISWWQVLRKGPGELLTVTLYQLEEGSF